MNGNRVTLAAVLAICIALPIIGIGCDDKDTSSTPAEMPAFTGSLQGSNPVRVSNPNEFSVRAGLRSGGRGVDFSVPANGVKAVHVPDGSYDVYFIYSSQPGALYQGDSFTLRRNGVEIRIVKVVAGNYNIRQVR